MAVGEGVAVGDPADRPGGALTRIDVGDPRERFLVEEALYIGARADVGLQLDVFGGGRIGLQLAGGLFEVSLFDVDEGEFRAFAGEAEGDAAADAASGAGDEGDAAVEAEAIEGNGVIAFKG